MSDLLEIYFNCVVGWQNGILLCKCVIDHKLVNHL